MAFQNKNLSVIAYANGFTLWHYAAKEAMTTITAALYSESVKTLKNTGDVIIRDASDTKNKKKITVDENITVADLA